MSAWIPGLVRLLQVNCLNEMTHGGMNVGVEQYGSKESTILEKERPNLMTAVELRSKISLESNTCRLESATMHLTIRAT